MAFNFFAGLTDVYFGNGASRDVSELRDTSVCDHSFVCDFALPESVVDERREFFEREIGILQHQRENGFKLF
jgi:hypothetical protein